MKHATRTVLAIALLAGTFADGSAQESYPARTVRIIVPTAAGGPSDRAARLIAQEFSKRSGRQVIVETRPGAGTIIGSDAVAKAAPDGYTLLLSPSTLAINPASYRKMPYNALTDFAPITQTHFVPNLFVVHPSLPVKSTREFIAFAKARPNEILYGSSGHGTNPHLTVELFASMAKIKLYHVPYKGTAPGLTDLLAGRVVVLATSSVALLKRSEALPDIPSISETVPGYESVQWSALMAPAATPADIIARLHKETVSILRMAEIRNSLASESAEIVGGSPEELAAFLRAETTKWAKVAKAAGVEPQ
jgi:tripartite-type tricarboxylate transporter receptor subunit TctC